MENRSCRVYRILIVYQSNGLRFLRVGGRYRGGNRARRPGGPRAFGTGTTHTRAAEHGVDGRPIRAKPDRLGATPDARGADGAVREYGRPVHVRHRTAERPR